ncbi:MAG: DUF2304 domain-containing protein [Patescibacteria group bacterium]|jgi:hypothetical protein
MIGLQIVAILFALWMVYFSYLHFRRGEFNKLEFILWQLVWAGLVVVVIFPASVQFILKTFSISRTFDLIVIIAIIILFGITFRNYVIVKRIEKKLTKLVIDESLKGIKADTSGD